MILPQTDTPPGKAPETAPVVDPTPPPPSDKPADPPAGTIVATAPISESSVKAQRELEEVNRKLKETELRYSQLEDENKKLKAIPQNPLDDAAKNQKKSFLSGWRPIID